MENKFVKYEVADRIALLTIDNPPVNVLTWDVNEELINTFDNMNEREDVSVAILTAAGDKFSAGRDIKAIGKESLLKRARLGREREFGVLECTVPVIGAINGLALGGGCGMALVCDMVIASERAVFGMPMIDVGRVSGYKFLSRVIPELRARQMMFTGERIDAAEAYRIGLVNKVVPHDQLMPEAWKLARTIAAKSPVVVRMMKKEMIFTQFLDVKNGYFVENQLNWLLSTSADAKEAAKAFVEKRGAKFEGH